jgi:hypothetical protein
MSTKLTLRLNEKLINKAKKAAKIRGVSLSKLVADYFQLVTVQKKREVPDSPILSEVEGILSSKADNKKLLKSYKKHIEEKYL